MTVRGASMATVLVAVVFGASATAWRQHDSSTGFLEVPGGTFTMGADPARDPGAFTNERWSATASEGTVQVPTFYISRRAVTVGEFAAFVQSRQWTVDARALTSPVSRPVTFVSWPDALAYCRWLDSSLKTSASSPPQIKALLQSGWRVTLPTEAEWEKAARVLPATEFAWGAVSEWTRSPYQPYPYDPGDDRENLSADALWVIRGGVLEDGSQKPRATTRVGADPGARRAFIGFRVAISQPVARTP